MGLCTYNAFPSSEVLTGSGAVPLIGIFIFTNTGSVGPCGFSVSFVDPWVSAVTINGPNVQSFFAVTENLGPPRNTNIIITDNGGGGTLLIPVSQGSSGCSYSLAPTSLSLNSSAHPAQIIALTTTGACSWNASCPDPWVTINTPNGTGAGNVSISIGANAGVGRNTIVTIGGVSFPIAQAGTTCGYSVSPASVSADPDGQIVSVMITTTAGCAWTPTGAPDWITLPGGPGTGIGTIPIVVGPNTGSATPRVGTFVVAGITVTVTQGAGQGAGFGVTTPAEIFCVNGTTRPVMRDRIRRQMGVTPPIDNLPLGVAGEPPMGQPTPTNAEINNAITDSIRWINDKVGFNGSTAVNISVPAYTGIGPQYISLTGVGTGSGTNQNNIDAIQKAVWNPGSGQALVPLFATSQAEQDRLETNWDNMPASVPQVYLWERYQVGILPGAQTAGTLQLYCTTAVYDFCSDTDILVSLPIDYEIVLEQMACLYLSQRRPQEPGAQSRIQYLSAQTEEGIRLVGDYFNDNVPQVQRSIGMTDLRRGYGTRRIRR